MGIRRYLSDIVRHASFAVHSSCRQLCYHVTMESREAVDDLHPLTVPTKAGPVVHRMPTSTRPEDEHDSMVIQRDASDEFGPAFTITYCLPGPPIPKPGEPQTPPLPPPAWPASQIEPVMFDEEEEEESDDAEPSRVVACCVLWPPSPIRRPPPPPPMEAYPQIEPLDIKDTSYRGEHREEGSDTSLSDVGQRGRSTTTRSRRPSLDAPGPRRPRPDSPVVLLTGSLDSEASWYDSEASNDPAESVAPLRSACEPVSSTGPSSGTSPPRPGPSRLDIALPLASRQDWTFVRAQYPPRRSTDDLSRVHSPPDTDLATRQSNAHRLTAKLGPNVKSAFEDDGASDVDVRSTAKGGAGRRTRRKEQGKRPECPPRVEARRLAGEWTRRTATPIQRGRLLGRKTYHPGVKGREQTEAESGVMGDERSGMVLPLRLAERRTGSG